MVFDFTYEHSFLDKLIFDEMKMLNKSKTAFKTSFCALSKLAEQAKMHLVPMILKVMPLW